MARHRGRGPDGLYDYQRDTISSDFDSRVPPVTIDLQKGVDYHEVESPTARDSATAPEAQDSVRERATRLEGGSVIESLLVGDFAELERRILAAMHEKAGRRPRR